MENDDRFNDIKKTYEEHGLNVNEEKIRLAQSVDGETYQAVAETVLAGLYMGAVDDNGKIDPQLLHNIFWDIFGDEQGKAYDKDDHKEFTNEQGESI